MFDVVIIFCAKYLIFLLVATFIVVGARVLKNKRVDFLFVSLLGGGLAFLVSRLCSLLYYNPRPFTVETVMPLIAHAPDNGFPSDHALLAFTLAAIVYTFNRRAGVIFFCVATAVGIGRVLAGVHSPEDIVGSLAIAVLSVLFVRRVLPKRK